MGGFGLRRSFLAKRNPFCFIDGVHIRSGNDKRVKGAFCGGDWSLKGFLGLLGWSVAAEKRKDGEWVRIWMRKLMGKKVIGEGKRRGNC